MPETRYIREYEQGTGKLLRTTPYIISDAQLADEAQEKEVQKIINALGEEWTPAQTTTRVKMLIRRLLAKGLIP